MPGGVDAAGEGWIAGQADVVDLVPPGRIRLGAELVARPVRIGVVGRIGKVGGCVQPIDLDPGLRDEALVALGTLLEGGLEALAYPSVLVVGPALLICHGPHLGGMADVAATDAPQRGRISP